MTHDFQYLKEKRYVRDNLLLSMQGEFFTAYDYPFIEEIRPMLSKTDDRIVVLVRQTYDFIKELDASSEALGEATLEQEAKPEIFEHVTYGSDVSELEVPFDLDFHSFIVYSEGTSGRKLLTSCFSPGGFMTSPLEIKMTAPIEKVGEIEMFNHRERFDRLVDIHSDRLAYREDYITGLDLASNALDTFDSMMRYSRHLV